MIKVDGFKAFHGTATIVPTTDLPSFKVTGDWLYRPDFKCWYVQPARGFSKSFPAEIVTDFVEEECA